MTYNSEILEYIRLIRAQIREPRPNILLLYQSAAERLEMCFLKLRREYEPKETREYRILVDLLLDKIERIANKNKMIENWQVKDDLVKIYMMFIRNNLV